MAVVGGAAAFPPPRGGAFGGGHRVGPDAAGSRRLCPRPFGLRDREHVMAVGAGAQRSAPAQLLVLHDRRPFGDRAPAPHRRGPHHGGERLPARRFDVARYPGGPGRRARAPARGRDAPDRRRERGAAVPPPAPPLRRLAPRPVTGATAAGGEGHAPGGPAGAPVVVDADGHVVEPRACWDAVPDPYRPRIVRDAGGFEHVVVDDTEILAVPLGTLATPGAHFDDPSSFRTLEEAHPGGSDPVARLADMDAEGIDQAVLFPSIGLYFWAHDELGFAAAFVRPNPCCGRSLSDRAYDPLWDAAEETGMAIGVHEGSSVIVPTLGSDRPFNPLVLHAVSHPFEEMLACAQLIAWGVLEHHPGLRVVFLESGGGWVPFWLERLDEQAESFGGFCPDLRLRPSEYFARQCWVSYEIDEHTLPALTPYIGEHRVVWGSDYPHHDATFPGALDTLRRTIAPLDAAVQALVLGANAAELYRLPPRGAPPAANVGTGQPAPADEPVAR